MRSAKAMALQKWYNNGFYKKDQLISETFNNAVVLPLKKDPDDQLQFGKGGVIANREYIESSGIEGRVGGYYTFDNPEYRDQKVVYCGALIRQWGHFLVESVSRLWYWLENDDTIDRYVFISNNSWFGKKEDIRGNYREFFELLGIWNRLDIVTSPIEYKEVVIPELAYSRKYYYSNQYKAIFNRVIKKALESSSHKSCPEKIFLSRARLKKAVQNECGLDLLDHYFVINGYSVLYPETITLSELIQILHGAETCAAESGTLPHNFLFCEDGKKIEIIERQTTVNEIQANLDQVRDFDVTYIDAHFMIHPTQAGGGPYFFAYNRQFELFTKDRGYLPPEEYYRSEKYIKQNLKKFLVEYKNSYGMQWGFDRWQLMYVDAYYEAYEDTCTYIGKYLSGEEPLFLKDYFSVHYIKKIIKKVLGVKKYRR